MQTRVYQYGCDPPIDYELVESQLRAAHDYQNELVAIERGRRDAMRLIYQTPEIQAAEETLKAATKSDVKAARNVLYELRRKAMEAGRERAKEINELAHELLLGARALTKSYWCTYIEIEARMQASRAAPLYADDGLTPANPRFRRWEVPMRGQLSVQLQAHGDKATTAGDLFGTVSNFARLVRGPHIADLGAPRGRKEKWERPDPKGKWVTLWMRVGSEGRAPVWARVRLRYHRALPDAARIKWIRLSCVPRSQTDGWQRETWTCEITVDDPAPVPRSLDTSLKGAVSVSWCWDKTGDDSIRVGEWRDTFGMSGEIVMPARVVQAVRKGDGIRAVRDICWNEVMPKLARSLKENHLAAPQGLPKFLTEAANTMHLWRSLFRVHDLARRWRKEAALVAPDSYAIIEAWMHRDRHLYDYEHHGRDQAIRHRRELYRLLAADWARRYRHLLWSNHRLDREAQFGDESDVRFTASPQQLRDALKNAFGADAVETRWDREEAWRERVCEAYNMGGARGDMFVERKVKTANAWADRKKKKLENVTSRKEDDNAAE